MLKLEIIIYIENIIKFFFKYIVVIKLIFLIVF